MICPNCGDDNLPGSEQCGRCQQDLTQFDRPIGQTQIERTLMENPVGCLSPAEPVHVCSSATVREALQKMLEHDIGAVLVFDNQQQLLGILSERDLLTRVAGLESA